MFMKDFLLDDTDAPSDMSVVCDSSTHNITGDKLNHKEANTDENKKKELTIKLDKDLLKFKAFFFLFFAGFGSTFPYLGIYFKQLGLNASFVGILAGVRPLIQFISGPFWALLADRYKARKAILLFSILAWLVMTLLLAFPRPHKEICKLTNITHPGVNIISEKPAQRSIVPAVGFQGRFGELAYTENCVNCRPQLFTNFVKRNARDDGNSSEIILNIKLENRNNSVLAWKRNQKSEEEISVQNGNHYRIKYIIERDQNEIRDIFYVLLVLIVIGEFLEAPSFIMIDTALLDHLGDEKKHYGKTRLFGSIGYGLASFSVGALLDKFQFEFCGKVFTNYLVIFYIFSCFMVIGFIFGLFFVKFKYSNTKESSKPMECIKVFFSLKYGSFLAICWFCGFCHGSIMNFLNWYLEDLGASKLMMGVATACRCSAIIFGFFVSSFFIDRVGHIQLICWALASYVGSYFGYSILHNPWWAIPVEVVQGLIYAISWSSCITYLGEAAPPNTAATMQGILQGVYWGLGTGSGAIAGGILINHIGVRSSYHVGGILSSIIFVLFCGLQLVIAKKEKQTLEKKIAGTS